VGPEDKVSRNFEIWGLERKASLKASWAETPKPEVPKSRSAKNESFENPKIAEPNGSSENLFELKCNLFLFILAYKC
jgi:hypothetical protein